MECEHYHAFINTVAVDPNIMSKKDYVLLASVLKKYTNSMGKTDYKVTGIALVNEMCMEIATALQIDNPRFDVGRFLVACGITE